MKLYIHIGSDKCGSTAIQKSLHLNRSNLIKLGHYVPSSGFGRENGHASCFIDKSGKVFSLLIQELKSIENEFSAAIISWEGIHFLNAKTLINEYKELKEFNSVALYYVRDQAEIIQSGILQQWKQSHCNVPFKKIFPETRKYYNIAERWSNFLGQKTIVVNYDRNKFPKNDIAYDFYNRIGFRDYKLLEPITQSTNDSLQYESALFLSHFGEHCEFKNVNKRKAFVNELISIQKQYSFSKYFFSKSDVAEIRDYYRTNNQQLCKNYGVNIDVNRSCWISDDYDPEVPWNLSSRILEKLASKDQYNIPVTLIDGWHLKGDHKYGIWTFGKVSKLAINIPKAFLKQKKEIFLTIKGEYSNQVAKRSNLIIDEKRFVKGVNLEGFQFKIDYENIGADGIIRLNIENLNMTSGLTISTLTKPRKISFRLEGLSCNHQPINY
ncbi:MAG: hypothetical protein RIC80_04245 [Cyclobacteriaceae bacterium]